MGDRGNIVVDGIFLYSHWGGSGLRETLARALRRGKERWNDPAFLTRIILCDMIKDAGSDFDSLIGIGISTTRQDYEHPDLVVNTNEGTVSVVEVGEDGKKGKARERKTFEDWIEKYENEASE
jgi:hypothetical protein